MLIRVVFVYDGWKKKQQQNNIPPAKQWLGYVWFKIFSFAGYLIDVDKEERIVVFSMMMMMFFFITRMSNDNELFVVTIWGPGDLVPLLKYGLMQCLLCAPHILLIM